MPQFDTIRLAKELSAGSQEAFNEIFRAYYGKVVNFVNSLVKSHSVSEDLSQEVFVNLWNSRHALGEVRSLNAYIYTIARNITIDYLRKRRIACDSIGKSVDFLDSEMTDEKYFAMEKELMIRLAVATFPERRRRIFTMSRFEGMSNSDIAETLGITKKTVENQINLSIRDIKKIIGAFSILMFFS